MKPICVLDVVPADIRAFARQGGTWFEHTDYKPNDDGTVILPCGMVIPDDRWMYTPTEEEARALGLKPVD